MHNSWHARLPVIANSYIVTLSFMHVQIIYLTWKLVLKISKLNINLKSLNRIFRQTQKKMLEIHVLLRFSLFVKKINISLLCDPKLTKMEILQVCQHALHEQVHIHK